MKTVEEYMENVENREEIIYLGGGANFIFCGTADEWEGCGRDLEEQRLAFLKNNYQKAQKNVTSLLARIAEATTELARTKAELDKFRPYAKREIINDYHSSTGKHCVIFEGDDVGKFWTRKEFEKFMDERKKPKEESK